MLWINTLMTMPGALVTAYWNGHGTSMCGVALYGDLEAADVTV